MDNSRSARLDRLTQLVLSIEQRMPSPAQLEKLQHQLTKEEVRSFRAFARWREIAMALVISGNAGWLGGPKVALALKILTAALPIVTSIVAKASKD